MENYPIQFYVIIEEVVSWMLFSAGGRFCRSSSLGRSTETETMCLPGIMTLPRTRASFPSSKYSEHMDRTMLASLSVQLKNPNSTRPSVMTTLKGFPSHLRRFKRPGLKEPQLTLSSLVMMFLCREFWGCDYSINNWREKYIILSAERRFLTS